MLLLKYKIITMKKFDIGENTLFAILFIAYIAFITLTVIFAT